MNDPNEHPETVDYRAANDDSVCARHERNMLFGVLAVVNGFIDQDAFDAAKREWETDTSRSLPEILVSKGACADEDRAAIDNLLVRYLVKHDNNSESSLPSISLSPTVSLIAGQIPETVAFTSRQRESEGVSDDFGDYKLLHEIAKGGMGVVYKARQKKLNRLVALKMIRSGEFADEDQVKRFYSEAEAAAKLDHAGIVPVFEVGEASGQHFYSMAYVEGQSLHARVKDEGPIAARQAALLMKTVAEAVQYAHDKGVIHRDIKPQNILLDRKEHPRVTDFGLAKDIHSDSGLTATGQVMGTPSYMPPEQAVGKTDQVNERADVYALGATLYFLLTGRPPFQAASAAETIRQVIDDEPAPPGRLNPAIPRDLETICLRCLRKEADRRYAIADELAADLGRWLSGEAIHARPVGRVEKTWMWCKRRPSIAASIAVVLMTVTAVAAILEVQRRDNTQRIAKARRENDQARARSHVRNVLSAPAAGLPYAIKLLEPFEEFAVPILQDVFESSETSDDQRLNASVALAHFGDVRVDYLVSDIRNAPNDQGENIATALNDQIEAVRLLQHEASVEQSDAEPNWEYVARLAILGTSLGDLSLARQMSQARADPTPRTALIETIPKWRTDVNGLAELLRLDQDHGLQYAVVLGIAELDRNGRKALDLPLWHAVLTETYRNSTIPGVHSASGLAMRRLGLNLPTFKSNSAGAKANEHSCFFTNSVGMEMLRVPAGQFLRSQSMTKDAELQTVSITQPFFMSDREATKAQFDLFFREKQPDDPTADDEWVAKNRELPAEPTSWNDAVEFCNWLSRREGLESCYELKNGEWQWNQAAIGYRLPTEAEWEYACRAGAATSFPHGESDTPLISYAVYSATAVQPCASRLPNSFGMFDMVGNVREWCFDKWDKDYEAQDHVRDPSGPKRVEIQPHLVTRCVRGGSFSSGVNSSKAQSRRHGNPRIRATGTGFRVTCSQLRR